MNNHLSVVGNLLDEGDFSEAKEYFRSISGYMQTANRKFCRNSVVNAVINVKYQMMTDAFIDAFLNIDIDKMMFIDDVSLCTILPILWTMPLKSAGKLTMPQKKAGAQMPLYRKRIFQL